MPSPLHYVFCAKIVEEISRQLKRFAQKENPCADFVKEVDHLATSLIIRRDKRWKAGFFQAGARRIIQAPASTLPRCHYRGVLFTEKSTRFALSGREHPEHRRELSTPSSRKHLKATEHLPISAAQSVPLSSSNPVQYKCFEPHQCDRPRSQRGQGGRKNHPHCALADPRPAS
jgi:hypothetical protein